MHPAFSFDASSGAFFGWDPMTGTYDKTSWGYQTDGFDTWNMRFDGEFSWVRGERVPAWAVPSQPRCERNITLQDPACAWVRLQEFLARYDLDTVATVCGVERSLLERAYGAFAATGAVEGAGKVLARRTQQHGTGPGGACAVAVVQLLLSNIGVPGGASPPPGGALRMRGWPMPWGFRRTCSAAIFPGPPRARRRSRRGSRPHRWAAPELATPVPWCRPCASGGARRRPSTTTTATIGCPRHRLAVRRSARSCAQVAAGVFPVGRRSGGERVFGRYGRRHGAPGNCRDRRLAEPHGCSIRERVERSLWQQDDGVPAAKRLWLKRPASGDGGRLLQSAVAVEPAGEVSPMLPSLAICGSACSTCTTPRAVRRRIRSLRPGGTT